MAWGRRCDLGCESWPDSDAYDPCPVCDQETTRFSNLTVLDPAEARSRVNQLKFEDYYEARCAELGITSDGPMKYLETGKPVPELDAEPA